MKPKIWEGYVADSYEIVKKDQIDPFTAHLNSIDHTGSIQFTDEPEVDTISFLDMKIRKKKDSFFTVTVYRK